MSTKGFRGDPQDEPLPEAAREFVQGAASHTVAPAPAPEPKRAEPKPWELANPRIKIPFTMRMDEPLHAKLAYVAARVPNTSMHAIMLQAAQEKLDAMIRELDRKG